MVLKNCKNCDRVFQFTGNPLCSRCVEEKENDYQIVKEYLRKHPGSSVSVIEEETGVSADKILTFLKEDRLEIKDEDEYILKCESCGEKIPSGRMCRKCMSNLEREIKSFTKTKDNSKDRKSNGDVKFRIADRYDKK